MSGTIKLNYSSLLPSIIPILFAPRVELLRHNQTELGIIAAQDQIAQDHAPILRRLASNDHLTGLVLAVALARERVPIEFVLLDEDVEYGALLTGKGGGENEIFEPEQVGAVEVFGEQLMSPRFKLFT